MSGISTRGCDAVWRPVSAFVLALATLGIGLFFVATDLASAQPPPIFGYSPYVDRDLPDDVYFGDTHLHTSNSPDAFLFGVKLGPEAAYRLAKGEKVVSTHGLDLQLRRPLDFLVVADHAEYMGLMTRLFSGNEKVLATHYGRMLYDLENSEETGFYEAAMILIRDLSMNERKMRVPELESEIWRRVAEEADQQNRPGVFTALTGYEWTSMIVGNNLHRIVIYKGDAEATGRLIPASFPTTSLRTTRPGISRISVAPRPRPTRCSRASMRARRSGSDFRSRSGRA